MPKNPLQHLRDEFAPEQEARRHAWARVSRRISIPAPLRELRADLEPSAAAKERVWRRIHASIEPVPVRSLLDRVRDVLEPAAHLRSALWRRILDRLLPVPVLIPIRVWRWGGVAMTLLILLRLSPALLFAPPTVADSPVLLSPTRGQVAVLIGGLWQPLNRDMFLTRSVLIQTQDGEATVAIHDDGVVRLGKYTTVALHDIADRPARTTHEKTITVHKGQVWIQGLLLPYIQGWTIAVPRGQVVMSEGSVSIAIGEGDVTDVKVWDRRAIVVRDHQQMNLVAGEHVQLWENSVPTVRKIPASQHDDAWVAENTRRDGSHRREIAQWQHERQVAAAGVLPTSYFYRVKRGAEAVDMFLTLGSEARNEKRMEQAKNRLNEAAALIAGGNQTDGAALLEEYRDTVLTVASGSGENLETASMLQQELTEASSDVAASLPGDASYALKKVVLETSAAVRPDDEAQIQRLFLTDSLAALTRSVEEGDVTAATLQFKDLQPSLAGIGNPALPREVSTEAMATLGSLATLLKNQTGSGDTELLKEVSQYLPQAPVVRHLTEAEIDAVVEGMVKHIFLYKMSRSRWNQLMAEFHTIENSPDQGTILRHLYRALPENGLAQYVRTEIQRVRELRGV